MKRNEKLKLTVTFLDAGGKVLLKRGLTSVPLRETEILRLSREFFDDPEPCMIHRSAVMSRMYMELLEYFMSQLEQGNPTVHSDGMPDKLVHYMDVGGYRQIILRETAG